jgi:peptide/nickel transport system substrate-binding protein
MFRIFRFVVLFAVLFISAACAPAAAPTSAPPPPTAAPPAAAVPTQAAPAQPAPTQPAPTQAAAATKVPPTAVPPTSAPVKDTLVVGQTVDPPNLNPYETTAAYANVYANIMEPLMYIDKDANGNATFKMLLATDYKWLDTTTLQFKLRPGVTFSNGEPFNADAAKFSLEQLFSAFSYTQWLQGLLKQVTIVDPMTVNVVLTKPASIVPTIIAMGGYQVPPKDFAARGKDAFNAAPIGTGPWVFKDHVKDDHITLTANPNYWGGTPKFKQILYRIIPDDNARVAALEAGEIDLTPNVPYPAADRIAGNKSLQLITTPSLRNFATFFDTDNPKAKPLLDVKVRQALNYAIDRAGMCKTLFSGRCTPLDGQYLNKTQAGYDPTLKPFAYDAAKAKQMLADAGYASGFEVDFTYTAGRYALDKEAGQAIAGYLRAVGLTVNEKAVDFPEFAREFEAKPRQTTALYQLGFLFGQDGYLTYLSYMPGIRFRSAPMPATFDDNLAKVGNAPDEATRIKLLQDIEKSINAEPFAVYLYTIDDLYGAQSWVTGFAPRPDQTIRLTTMGVTPK